MSRRIVGPVIGVTVGLAVIASIWAPVLLHYHVATPALPDATIEQMRATPDDAVLERISSVQFLLQMDWQSDTELIAAADGILDGRFSSPHLPAASIGVPFSERDLEHPDSRLQLAVAGLALPRVLLDAYGLTGRDEYLLHARDMLAAFARFDEKSRLPRGLQWNDHAVAAGMLTIAQFWLHYRRHPAYDTDAARPILELAARNAAMLAKPGHFTFATNHGVLQNLGLLHYAAAFPLAPRVAQYTDLAVERLTDQMKFFMSSEGVVLEHSFGYHAAGTDLLARSIDYLGILGREVPQGWRQKLRGAEDFYATITRPDWSQPKVGDTIEYDPQRDRNENDVEAPLRTPGGTSVLQTYPVAGYAVLWDRIGPLPAASQTVLAWSNFAGHGHKHADELSMLLWADGVDWWTNVGYWPYDDPRRQRAVSWSGSSAPHAIGEPYSGERSARVLSTAHSAEATLLDAIRTTAAGYEVRRQLVHVAPDRWLVIDSQRGTPSPGTRTVWTASHAVEVEPDANGCYRASSPLSSAAARVCITGEPAPVSRLVRASMEPFAGWQVVSGEPRPTASIVVEQPPGGSWAAMSLQLEPASHERTSGTAPPLVRFTSAETWSADIPRAGEPLRVERAGATLTVGSATLELEPAPSAAFDEVAAIEAAYQAAELRYPRMRTAFLPYRAAVTKVLLAALLVQELLFALGTRFASGLVSGMRWVAVAAWLGGAVWLHVSYFAA